MNNDNNENNNNNNNSIANTLIEELIRNLNRNNTSTSNIQDENTQNNIFLSENNPNFQNFFLPPLFPSIMNDINFSSRGQNTSSIVIPSRLSGTGPISRTGYISAVLRSFMDMDMDMLNSDEENDEENSDRPLSYSIINIESLKEIINNNEKLPMCSICYEDFKYDTKICMTECIHFFCYGCLSEWLNSKKTCPLCRTKI